MTIHQGPRPAGRARATRAILRHAAPAALSLLVGGGCASGPGARPDGLSSGAPMSVRIEGLEFLTLGATRQTALDLLRRHGYDCQAEAASAKHAACTCPGAAAVVLSFAGEALDAVRTALPIANKRDPRDQFDDLFNKGRRTYPQAFVQRTEDVAVARFLPGDGTSIEVRYFLGADAIQEVQYAPAKRPEAPKVTRR